MQPSYRRRQQAHARLRLLRDAQRLGNVSEACRRHSTARKTYCKWKGRCDDVLANLMDQPRTPHRHPTQLTVQEYELIERVARSKSYTDKHGRHHHVGLHRLHQLLVTHHGFTRSVGGLDKALKRLGYYAPAKARR